MQAALKGGAEILDVYGSEDFRIELKEDDSPLTLADRKSHYAVQTLLTKRFPETPILSEEGRTIPFDERINWPEFWMIDPLDGTKEFIKRNGEYTVNVALIRSGNPVLGVVYVPVTDVLYYGVEGLGSYRLRQASKSSVGLDVGVGEKLPIAKTASPGIEKPVRVVASRSHFSAETEEFVQQLKTIYGKVETVNAGSAVKICLVAEGSADIYPRFAPTMEWDVAAGAIVAREAECMVIKAADKEPMIFNKRDLVNPWFIVGRHPFA